jgi:hypothetical protein
MRRSDALAPLSRDHHVALEAALRLRRATPEDVGPATARFNAFWIHHGRRHFEIEEALILPALPPGDAEWDAATARVRVDHADIAARARSLEPGDVDAARELGERLHAHVRFEERVLFALLERRADPDALAALGEAVASAR